MEGQEAGDEDSWGQEGDGSSTSDSEAAEHSTGPTTGVSAGGSVVGNSTTHGGGDAGATSTSRPKRTNRKRSKGGRIAADITKDELAQHFNMPTEEAAKRLGIGLTVLKRVCRKHGVTRWPYRKVKSLDRLIVNVQSGVAPGQSNKHLMVSPAEILQHKEKMCAGGTLDIGPETRRLQQAYSKFNHKLRKTHKYDLTTLQMLAGSSSAEGEASHGQLAAASNVAGPRATETSSQHVPDATLVSGVQEVDSNLRPRLLTDEGPDAASRQTGPLDASERQLPPHPTPMSNRSRPPAAMDSIAADANRLRLPPGPGPGGTELTVPALGAGAAGTVLGPVDAGNPAVPGAMTNSILHSIPPWATLSTFLSGAGADVAPAEFPHGPSRAWLDLLGSHDGVLPSQLFSSLHTPSIPLLTRFTAAAMPLNADASPSPPTTVPQVPGSHPNILLHAATNPIIPATHAFALNGAWQMPPGAVFNASLAILPHTSVNTTPAVVGVTPFGTAALPVNLPMLDTTQESNPAIPGLPGMSATVPSSHPTNPSSTGTATSAAGSPASPFMYDANPSMPAVASTVIEQAALDNVPSSSRASANRKRSVFEKVQQELAGRGSLPTAAQVGAAPATPVMPSPPNGTTPTNQRTDTPPAKRLAPNPANPSHEQALANHDGEGVSANALLDKLLPVSMFSPGVGAPSSHSMLAHVMDPPVLLSVNLQSLQSLLPFFHSTELPGAVSQAQTATNSHGAKTENGVAKDRPPEGTAADGSTGLPAHPLLPPLPCLLSLPRPLPSLPVAHQMQPPAVTTVPEHPTHVHAPARPQADAVAILQHRAHQMSRVTQNPRLTPLSRAIPAGHMLETLLGGAEMANVSDAQALGVLQLSALEMGWVLESVEMLRLSMPLSSNVPSVSKSRSVRSRVTSISGRPPVPMVSHALGTAVYSNPHMQPSPLSLPGLNTNTM